MLSVWHTKELQLTQRYSAKMKLQTTFNENSSNIPI